jgi:hypothetical protein
MSKKDYALDAILGGIVGGLGNYDPAHQRPGLKGFLPGILSGAAQMSLKRRQSEEELRHQMEERDRAEAMKLRLDRIQNPIPPIPDSGALTRSLPGVASGHLSPEQRAQIIPEQFRPPEEMLKTINKLGGQRIGEQFESPEERAARMGELGKKAGEFVGAQGAQEQRHGEATIQGILDNLRTPGERHSEMDRKWYEAQNARKKYEGGVTATPGDPSEMRGDRLAVFQDFISPYLSSKQLTLARDEGGRGFPVNYPLLESRIRIDPAWGQLWREFAAKHGINPEP